MEKYRVYIQKFLSTPMIMRILRHDRATREMVDVLYRRQDKEKRFREIWCQRLLLFFGIAAAAVMFFLAAWLEKDGEVVIEEGHFIHTEREESQVTFGVQAQTQSGDVQDTFTLDVAAEEEDAREQTVEETPDPKEVLLGKIREEVQEAVEKSKGEEKIVLPQTVSGVTVEYTNPEQTKDYSAALVMLGLLALLPVVWRQQQKELLEKREQELMLDYPEIVNKVMLLFSAGLTVRSCFERMEKEYEKRLGDGEKRRFVYEEIGFAYQEMKNGVSESDAIQRFGRRCRQLPYLRFASLINQNIRKGSEGLTTLLEVEALDAFEKRKEAVKAMGETAGTKLLIPMVLMLAVVMAIIIVPAFMTM